MDKRVRKPAKRMTNERVVAILMQEMADVRLELKQDIHELKTDIRTIKGDLSTLRLEVHQNQLTFMSYMDRTDRRIDKLEAKTA